MKKIYYLLAFIAVVFSACQKQPVVTPTLSANTTPKQTLAFTLQQSDYQLLTSGYPKTSFTFDDDADAQKYIPMILNAKYSLVANSSTAAVTYTQSALYFKLADSVYSTDAKDTTNKVYYSLTKADYLLLPKNTFTDFSLSQLLQWLPYKYASPANNTLKVINWTIYPATTVPATPYSFLYTNGAWKQIYMIQPAQYASIGLGKYNQLTSSNDSKIPSILNAFLKNDITVQDTVTKGDIVYVSYNYYSSGGDTFQRVQPLQYDGSNYVAPQTGTRTLNFIKQNDTWGFVQPLPVVNYTLTDADFTLIANGTAGTAAQRSNLGQYKDFETSWAKADLQSAFIPCLLKDIASPKTQTTYRVHYPAYVGGSDADTTLDFTWDGTKWVAAG